MSVIHIPLLALSADQLALCSGKVRQELDLETRAALSGIPQLGEICSDAVVLDHVRNASMCVELNDPSLGQYHIANRTTDRRIDEYDCYFQVSRVLGRPLHVFTHSVLCAFAQLLQNKILFGTSISLQDWAQLKSAFYVIIAFIIGQPIATFRAKTSDVSDQCEPPEALDPMVRWRIGHHAFIVSIQSLVLMLDDFECVVREDKYTEAGEDLHAATIVMLGATAALKFTGDFQQKQYLEVVQPSMMPPHMGPGFSGLMSADHQCLVKTLVRLKPVFRSLPPELHTLHGEFLMSLDMVYEAHKYVCSRFNGEGGRSLRMACDSEKSATDVLDELKRKRMSLVQTGT